ncbi:aldehyde dehydrogenase family protein [Kitasatospora kifunensis]|uniref:aldehyde dehydrogenase (NAD(+)) n=1 Tax=Kitasatospora kifunensis TaxID=58351 RepID=A0A7W7R9V0_KITKI|nr:aldehyde dehydrogenase family protein [Kitasatospora kifunensis]MBB4928097.1 aldehyde dehydrogenase (NAD+) [Kitasatospora kifunensis]MBB4928326.1 aldehyde dehydrogenase (NAD+) [Kitasatospora kifunensis]
MTRTISSVLAAEPVAVAGPGRRVHHSVNPADLAQSVAEVELAPAEVFGEACARAHAAQQGWADVPAPVRGRVVAAIGRLVEQNAEALAQLVTREVGKTLREARGEVQEIVDTCDFFLGEGRRLYGQTVPSEMPDKQLFTFREPIGTVAVVTAGNFPVAVPSWYIVPALLCGNAVVWKPAEYAAACAQALFDICIAAGLPAGVLNIVHADGEATFAGLEGALAAGHLDKVGFTGSTEVGSRIGELCGRYLQSPCLELGGKNPMYIAGDADLELAVEGALFSGFGTAGQRCTSLGLLLVDRSVHDEFLSRLASALEAAPIGDPTRDVLYGPLLDERFAKRFEEHLGLVEDHHRLLGSPGTGRVTAANPRPGFVGDDPQAGLFYHPTLVAGARPGDRLLLEETFGPIVPVAEVDGLDQAVELANASGYGLSASVYTDDPRTAFSFRRRVRAGMVSVNNSTSGAEAHLPFGGNGRSGNGSRQSGIWVLDQFTRWQALNWDYSGTLQKAQMDVGRLTGDHDFRLVDEMTRQEPPR